MNDEQLLKEVWEIIEKYSFDQGKWDKRSRKARIIQDLGINSARVVDIIIDVEEKFDVEIEDESLESISTFNDIVEILKKKMGLSSS